MLKKFIVISIVFLAILGASAHAQLPTGCSPGDRFNRLTGQPCVASTAVASVATASVGTVDFNVTAPEPKNVSVNSVIANGTTSVTVPVTEVETKIVRWGSKTIYVKNCKGQCVAKRVAGGSRVEVVGVNKYNKDVVGQVQMDLTPAVTSAVGISTQYTDAQLAEFAARLNATQKTATVAVQQQTQAPNCWSETKKKKTYRVCSDGTRIETDDGSSEQSGFWTKFAKVMVKHVVPNALSFGAGYVVRGSGNGGGGGVWSNGAH